MDKEKAFKRLLDKYGVALDMNMISESYIREIFFYALEDEETVRCMGCEKDATIYLCNDCDDGIKKAILQSCRDDKEKEEPFMNDFWNGNDSLTDAVEKEINKSNRTDDKVCSACGGSGERYHVAPGIVKICDNCKGSGKVPEDKVCETCEQVHPNGSSRYTTSNVTNSCGNWKGKERKGRVRDD